MASETAKGLRDRRLNAWNEAKGLLEGAESRDMTSEEEQRYDACMTEVDKLDDRIKNVLDAEQRSREADEAYNAMAGKGVQRAVEGNSYMDEVRSWATGREGKQFMEIQRQSSGALNLRTLGTIGTGGLANASATVPTDFYDQLIAYLIEVSGVLQTGPSVLKTAGGETLQIPTASNHVSAGMVNQASAIPAVDPSFTQRTLGAQKFGALLSVSREIIDDTAVDLLGYLAMSAGRAIGNAFGQGLVQSVAGNVMGVTNGILSAPVAITGASVTAGPTYANLIDMEYSVIAPYRQSRSCYWLAADKTIGGFRKLVDGNGRPIWEPSAVLGAPDLLLGKPLVADPYMPLTSVTGATPIAFGDFSQYFVRLVGGLRFERSDDFNFGSDVVTFRALLRGDGNYGDTTGGAVKLFKNAAS